MYREPLYINSDAYVEYLDARDSADNLALNSATVTYTLYRSALTPGGARVAVSGGTGTLTYVGGSSGNYRGTIQSTVTATLTVGLPYEVEIVFVQGGYDDLRTLYYRAARRGAA